MCIIKAIFIGIGAILFEAILCVGRIFTHIIQRVAALFSLLFLLSAVLAVIQNGVFTYMTGVSVLGFVLCFLVPFVFQLFFERCGSTGRKTNLIIGRGNRLIVVG